MEGNSEHVDLVGMRSVKAVGMWSVKAVGTWSVRKAMWSVRIAPDCQATKSELGNGQNEGHSERVDRVGMWSVKAVGMWSVCGCYVVGMGRYVVGMGLVQYLVGMWSVRHRYESVCGWYVVGLWSVCGWFVVGMWLVCGRYVVGLWSVCGRYVVGLWLVCGWFVVGMWSVCVHNQPASESRSTTWTSAGSCRWSWWQWRHSDQNQLTSLGLSWARLLEQQLALGLTDQICTLLMEQSVEWL